MEVPSGVDLPPQYHVMLAPFLEETALKEQIMEVADHANRVGRDAEALATNCRALAADIHSCENNAQVMMMSEALATPQSVRIMAAIVAIHHNVHHHHSKTYPTMRDQLIAVLPEMYEGLMMLNEQLERERSTLQLKTMLMDVFGGRNGEQA